MDGGTDRSVDEVTRLRRCVNDLVSVLALPALWAGDELSRIATTLLDVLVRILELDFAYLRISDSVDGSAMEWARRSEGPGPDIPPHEIGRALERWLGDDVPLGTRPISSPIGNDVVSIAPFRLGLHDTGGLFVAGSHRSGFPTESERLVLQVAVNQAAIGWQEARHRSLQRRATQELERRVAERTAELAAVNAALGEEVLERCRAQEQTRRQELELRLLVDSMPECLEALAPDGAIIHMNRAGIEYLGLTLDDVVRSEGARARMYHPEDLDTVERTLKDALSRGTSREFEARMRRHDGQYRWFVFRFQALRDEQGQILHWYVAGTDIEDRKRAEERMREENLALREELDNASMFEEIIGKSAALRRVLKQVEIVAPTDSTVLIYGETGTGKELIARAIHNLSRRRSHAFVKLNCAAIPTGLLESELFGHEKGAFTGAIAQRIGRFELANQGTVFLDEVGEIPLDLQTKLLRVLQEREFERLGSVRTIRTDARLIAATNRDLAAMVEAQRFRADLFYRLDVFPIHVPALRERAEDIPLLVRHFVHHFARRMNRTIDTIPSDTMEALTRYNWPGNIREVQNLIERAVILSSGPVLRVPLEDLRAGTDELDRRVHQTLAEAERAHIMETLKATRWVLAGPRGAARRLGMNRSTLQFRMKKLGIARPGM